MKKEGSRDTRGRGRGTFHSREHVVTGVALFIVGNTWSWAWHFSQYTHVGRLPNLIPGLPSCKHLPLLSVLSSFAIWIIQATLKWFLNTGLSSGFIISLISIAETSQIQNTSIFTSSDPIYLKMNCREVGETNLFAIWKSVSHIDMSP